MNIRVRFAFGIVIVLAFLYSLFASQESYVLLSGPTQGTTYQIKALCKDKSGLLQIVESSLEEVDASMSTWRQDSEITKFNQHKSTEPFLVSTGLYLVVLKAMEISRITSGLYDVTAKPLADAYGFGPKGKSQAPDQAEVQNLLNRVGYQKLILLPDNKLQKLVPELEIDLNSIAPGYTVDLLASRMEAAGIRSYLIDVGGELKGFGLSPRNEPWVIGINQPEEGSGPDQFHKIIPLRDMALATSGNYRSAWKDGVRQVVHSLDPVRGEPVITDVLSATVLHKNAMEADAWATAAMVLGSEKFLEIVNNQNEFSAYLITAGSLQDKYFEKCSQRFLEVTGRDCIRPE
ncbi:MAG: FAD:protein FMN transferase [Candidatus Cloacimonetes bacterium]|nr:FAD:protein FMN transferase [Candidatus Cloacimonadota bacterium]